MKKFEDYLKDQVSQITDSSKFSDPEQAARDLLRQIEAPESLLSLVKRLIERRRLSEGKEAYKKEVLQGGRDEK